MVRPVRARVRDIADDDSSCINVSGLSRVDCCCSQAMMRSAHAVPNKWFGHKARFFCTELTALLIDCFVITIPELRVSEIRAHPFR